jgi:hypothetical protein
MFLNKMDGNPENQAVYLDGWITNLLLTMHGLEPCAFPPGSSEA